MKLDKSKYFKLVVFALFLFGLKSNSAQAVEMTAVDFNGNVMGQVISTGMVINADGENIGYITADSLIVDDKSSAVWFRKAWLSVMITARLVKSTATALCAA